MRVYWLFEIFRHNIVIFMLYKLFKILYFYSWLYWINKCIKSFLAWRINFLLLNNYSVYGWGFIYNLFWLRNRIKIWKDVNLNNAILNVNSWYIYEIMYFADIMYV